MAKKEVAAAALDAAARQFAELPSPKELNAMTCELKAAVDDLQKAGIRTVFFEMPLHQRLFTSGRANAIRAALHETLPPSEYTYIDSPDCSSVGVTDGIHLDGPSSHRFTAQLVKALKNLRDGVDSSRPAKALR
ncbi:MAG: hypothetical protein FJ224_10135 [Lentisphaerae bacterium]|nr:hypothetical protein [Lentisphaerota bacterium]